MMRVLRQRVPPVKRARSKPLPCCVRSAATPFAGGRIVRAVGAFCRIHVHSTPAQRSPWRFLTETISPLAVKTMHSLAGCRGCLSIVTS